MSSAFTSFLNKLSSPNAHKPPKPRRTRTMPSSLDSASSSSSPGPGHTREASHDSATPERGRGGGGGGGSGRPSTGFSNVLRTITGRNRSASAVTNPFAGPGAAPLPAVSSESHALPSSAAAPQISVPVPIAVPPPLPISELLSLLSPSSTGSRPNDALTHLTSLAHSLSSSPPPRLPTPTSFLPLLSAYIIPPAPTDLRVAATQCLASYLSSRTRTERTDTDRSVLPPIERGQAYALIATAPSLLSSPNEDDDNDNDDTFSQKTGGQGPNQDIPAELKRSALKDIRARLTVLKHLLAEETETPLPILQGLPPVRHLLEVWATGVAAVRIRGDLEDPYEGGETEKPAALLADILSTLVNLRGSSPAEHANALVLLTRLVRDAIDADLERWREMHLEGGRRTDFGGYTFSFGQEAGESPIQQRRAEYSRSPSWSRRPSATVSPVSQRGHVSSPSASSSVPSTPFTATALSPDPSSTRSPVGPSGSPFMDRGGLSQEGPPPILLSHLPVSPLLTLLPPSPIPYLPPSDLLVPLLHVLLPLLVLPPNSPLLLPRLTDKPEDIASMGMEGKVWQAILAMLMGPAGMGVLLFIRRIIIPPSKSTSAIPVSPAIQFFFATDSKSQTQSENHSPILVHGALRALRLALRHVASLQLNNLVIRDSVSDAYGHSGGALSTSVSDQQLERARSGGATRLDVEPLAGLTLTRVAREVGASLVLRSEGEGESATDEEWEWCTRAASEAVGMLRDWLDEKEFIMDSGGKERVEWEEATAVAEMVDSACQWLKLARGPSHEPVMLDLARPGGSSAAPQGSFISHLTSFLGRVLICLDPDAPIHLFYTPLLTHLLPTILSLAPQLSPESARLVIAHYDTRYLLLPVTVDWEQNIHRLLEAFFLPVPDSAPTTTVDGSADGTSPLSPRQLTARLIFDTTFHALLDLPPILSVLLSILLPLSEDTLPGEPDPFVWRLMFDFLSECIVLRATAEEPGTAPPPDETSERIRALICKVARECSCTVQKADPGTAYPGTPSADLSTTTPQTQRMRRDVSPRPPIMGLLSGVLSSRPDREEASPASTGSATRSPLTSALPSPARGIGIGMASFFVGTPSLPSSPTFPRNTGSEPAVPLTPPPPHSTSCKSMAAILTLISLFTRLAFSPPHSLLSASRSARAPASSYSILVFRDILDLVIPVEDSPPPSPDTPVVVLLKEATDGPAACLNSRLAALQWLLRLRADRDHRLYVAKDLDVEADFFAALIGRTAASAAAMDAQEIDEEEHVFGDNVTVKKTTKAPISVRESRTVSRDRSSRSRSGRSRSRQPRTDNTPALPVSPPLWAIPESLPFEVDVGLRPSEGMTTYEATEKLEHAEDADKISPLYWLPVSAYVRVLVYLLSHETNWEIFSYVLCFLPMQLSNKHLFCGPRVQRVLSSVVNVLCKDVIADGIAQRVRFPDFIKSTDVHGLAYQTLTVLISYRQQLDRVELDLLVESLQQGLSRDSTTAKPCLQALAIAAFELETIMTRHISKILGKLTQIMSASATSVHIIELICVIGCIPGLFVNFTEEEYHRVFGVAVKYIQLHNDPKATDTGLSYALSQHILGLAYYSIYLWFLAIPLHDRAKHVPYIARALQLASQNKGGVDEPTEVCFDWLLRYAYANADPRPHHSFVADVVMTPSGEADSVLSSKSWLQGHSVITVRTLEKRGWSEVVIQRPSGMTSMFVRLMNVPTTGPGEYSPDTKSDQAMLMAERDPEIMREPLPTGGTVSSGTVEPLLVPGLPSDFMQLVAAEARRVFASVPHGNVRPLDPLTGYVWAASVPSQRRKPVGVLPASLPSVIGPFPGISQSSGALRSIPDGDLLDRLLRDFQFTPVIDTHKIGIMYVAPGQTTESEILSNRNGSPSYTRFLAGLARLIRLKGQKDIYPGGLDIVDDFDGQYAYAWWDDIGQIVYHTGTLMPNHPGDSAFTHKKRHIGNDHVRIVWNDSGMPYRFDTLATQFQFVNIVVEPHSAGTVAAYSASRHENEFFKITMQRDPNMADVGPLGPFKIVSAEHLPVIVRQVSLLADFFATVFEYTQRDTQKIEFITNWRQRLRFIKKFAERLGPVPVPEQVEGMPDMDFTKAY